MRTFKEGLDGWMISVLAQNGWSKEDVSVYVGTYKPPPSMKGWDYEMRIHK